MTPWSIETVECDVAFAHFPEANPSPKASSDVCDRAGLMLDRQDEAGAEKKADTFPSSTVIEGGKSAVKRAP